MTDGDSARLTRHTVVAAVVVVVALAAAVVLMWKLQPRLEPVEVSQQTTYLIAPTRADGWVDFPAQVNWMRRASLDAGGANAAVSLLRALGRDALPVGVDRDALLKTLGITDTGDASAVFKPLAKFTGPEAAPAPEPPPATTQWLSARCRDAAETKVPFARLRGWLAQSEAPFASLREASKAAALYVPVERGRRDADAFTRVNAPLLADAGHALGCDAAVKLLQGDGAASWDDVEAVWRLGQLLARTASVSEYGTALELWKTAATGTVDLAASPSTSPALLSAMQAGLGAKRGFAPASETWMFQRLAVLETNGTPLIAKPRLAAQTGGPLGHVGTTAKLTAINQAFDEIDVALQTADPRQRIARVDQLAAAMVAQTGIAGGAVLGVEIQAVSYQRLASLAVTLARHQRDGGKLPASLAELGEPLKDPGSGAAFAYKPDGTTFRLHGVGADGRDDGADSARDVVVSAQEPPRLGL